MCIDMLSLPVGFTSDLTSLFGPNRPPGRHTSPVTKVLGDGPAAKSQQDLRGIFVQFFEADVSCSEVPKQAYPQVE